MHSLKVSILHTVKVLLSQKELHVFLCYKISFEVETKSSFERKTYIDFEILFIASCLVFASCEKANLGFNKLPLKKKKINL